MNAKTAIGVVLIVLAASLAGGGFYALHAVKQAKLDPDTLCPLEGPKAITIIVIDKTDPLTAPEQAQVLSIAGQERDAAPPGGRIAVKLLKQKEGTVETVLDTVADLCNPGSAANPLFENPKRVAARYANAFVAPIDDALRSVSTAGSAPASPIAGAIASAVETVPDVPGPPVKLILISDLMEHTARASAYSGTLTASALQRLVPQEAKSKLKNTGIWILLLGRPRYAKQQEAAVAIWRNFLRAESGREPQFIQP